ncbi:GGDEF domain-containing protein [Arenimonas sp. MALMAid1274]|uniref:GGDEF domain-containing protein n=1 Tax=Arenimonas sp. MALMAid1274 TaxID=3411630 RepID=UPI003B9FFDFC
MQLDPFTTALIALLASAAMAAGLYAAASRQPRELACAQRLWARAIVLAPAGWLLLEWADDLPSLAVPGKTLIIASFVEYLRALVACRGRMPDSPWFAAPVLLVALASLLMLFTHPGQPMRTGLLSLLCAGLAASTSIVAWSQRKAATGSNALVVAASFGVCALVLCIRGTLLFLPDGSAARAWVQQPWGETLLLGGAMLAPAVASLGFVLMGSDRLLQRLEHLANTDSLTGLLTRHAFLERAGAHLAQSPTRPSSLLIMDLDHFKRINDAYGHDVGDQALVLAAKAMRAALRPQDLVGRQGGEEFAVLLPDTALPGAEAIARHLQDAVAGVYLIAHGKPVQLRVSIGVATLGEQDHDLAGLLKRADQAMYGAKRAGRDQVHAMPAGLA